MLLSRARLGPACTRATPGEHPSSCPSGSLCLFVLLFHGLSGESDAGGLGDTGDMCPTGGFQSPVDNG